MYLLNIALPYIYALLSYCHTRDSVSLASHTLKLLVSDFSTYEGECGVSIADIHDSQKNVFFFLQIKCRGELMAPVINPRSRHICGKL